MRTITLISTYHAEKGTCDVCALHQILERARPEVIFMEIPPSCFEGFFKEKSRSNLESRAVNRYLEVHRAEIVLVDVFEAPSDFIAGHERPFEKVDRVGSEYRMRMDHHSQRIAQYGFAYLNSGYCREFWSALYALVDVEMAKIGEEELLRTYESWKDVHERRDLAMMKAIQNYSEAHEFNTGMFLLGAAHRRSIMEKAGNLLLKNSVPIEWNFERYEGLIDGWRATAAAN